MAKRTATSDLNHDNWDREEDPEEAGSFERAKDDALKKRVIKVAKRRNPIGASSSALTNEENKSNIFGGFTGFTKAPASNFNFLSNLTQSETSAETNGNGKAAAKEDKDNKKIDEYYAKLKGLNESVSEWIKKHVAENPLVNLQPIFKDYDSYIAELEKLKSEASQEKKVETTTSQATTVTIPSFSFTAKSPTFSFGSNSNSKPAFSFGSSDSGKFSFASNVVKDSEPKSQEEDDDEPPKEEIKQVVEDGHIYSIRCKVFVKKEGNYVDLGIGTLYLKPIADSEKIQLIVRAETNLGRLVCNFILSEGIPMQRMGKKDVMLVCIPNPETQPPPVPVLFRVKSPEEADVLLQTLQKYKK